MQIVVLNGTLSEAEQVEYANYIKQKYPGCILEKLLLTVQDEYVDIQYIFCGHRKLSKMGGYLAGDPLTWNDAKRAEAADAVPHLRV